MSCRQGRSNIRQRRSGRRDRSPQERPDPDKSRSRSPHENASSQDRSLPENLTTTRLKKELLKKGVELPKGTGHRTLFNIYKQLHQSTNQTTRDALPLTRDTLQYSVSD